jgi:cyclopropane-fatty-acyl-phospholipid synthase
MNPAASHTVTHQELSIRPDRLLDRSRHQLRVRERLVSSRTTRSSARRLTHMLLAKLQNEQLIVHEQIGGRWSAPRQYGDRSASLTGVITVHDDRAYAAVLTQGSIGLGRGFIEGWWASDDPTTVVRVLIRNLEPLDSARNRVRQLTGWGTDRIRSVLPRHTRTRNREDISAHYDIGNEFFALFLDETMTYSSAVFPDVTTSLASASLHKYDMLLSKLGMSSSDHLLEIGTGWGGLAVRAVETYGCDVTTTTISNQQLSEATKRVTERGLASKVTLLNQDWRDLRGTYDRVISIEMIEAVDWRDYDDYFATIERSMVPDGLAAIQAICVPDQRYERAKNTEDFIRRFVFPNGFLPSIGSITKSVSRATRMHVVDVEDISPHYAETLSRWHQRFDERVHDVKALGLDDRFCRLWKFYLSYCEAGFRERHCTVVQVVLAGHDWRGAIPR